MAQSDCPGNIADSADSSNSPYQMSTVMRRNQILAIFFIVIVGIVCYLSGREFTSMWKPDAIYPSKSVVRIGRLSEYCPRLENTRANSSVYFIESGKPGATMLVLGGTHPNEPAGFITGVVLVENIKISEGKLIVIPQACESGFTSTDPLEGCPERFSIRTARGNRDFRFGARAANPIDQWPDPLVFLQYPSGQQLSGNETRNLNRAYPGRSDGTLTEETAYAIMQLIEKEHVDIAVDLHEAAPEIPIINAMVTHPKSRDLAAAAVLDLEFDGLQYSLELSPDNFHGLSHREWGDRTNAMPFLMETSNPIQGRLRGVTSADLIVNGKDIRYWKAAQLGTMRITYDLAGEPLTLRVGRHVQGLRAIISAFCEANPDKKLTYENLPAYNDLMQNGVGAYLQ
jgi:predicted deacylase